MKFEKKKIVRSQNEINKNTNDIFFDLILTSCRDAVKIQNELAGLMDAKSLAVTLLIAGCKINGNSLPEVNEISSFLLLKYFFTKKFGKKVSLPEIKNPYVMFT